MRKLILLIPLLMMACTDTNDFRDFDWQGHRGARGNYPENTTPAFFHALDQGMTTLEMDVVITADSQVVVSHEPFFNEDICHVDSLERDSLPNNIYKLTYEQVEEVDCGSKGNPGFADQQPTAIGKPLLRGVIEAADAYASQTGRQLPYYNIEIKSRPDWDGKYHPEVPRYADLLVEVLQEAQVAHRFTIQSFDDRALQYVHQTYPEYRLALLVEDDLTAKEHLDRLDFTPEIYSCYYPLVTKELVEFCHKKEMQIIPWTVNEEEQIRQLMNMGVDGVITDYPALKEKFIPRG